MLLRYHKLGIKEPVSLNTIQSFCTVPQKRESSAGCLFEKVNVQQGALIDIHKHIANNIVTACMEYGGSVCVGAALQID